MMVAAIANLFEEALFFLLKVVIQKPQQTHNPRKVRNML
jgi:hypothetical protein